MTKFCSKVQYIIGVIAITTLTLTSCKKDDTRVFTESADERIAKKLAEYQSLLSGATYGWKFLVEPGGGGAYGFYVKFNDANRVQMVSDFDSASAVDLKESSYRLKALQQPSLIFDTYSYLHVLSDPDGSINGGEDGSGLLSDFEFYFSDTTATTDTLHLTGRVNGSKGTLIKATQEEAAGYTNGEFNISLVRNAFGNILEYFKKLTVGGQDYDLNLNFATRTVIINWVDDQGTPNSFTTTMYFTLEGIEFLQPFVAGSTVVTGYYDPTWSNASQTISGNVGNNINATIKGVIKPEVLDVEAASRWWQTMANSGGYWVSLNGFHVDGVDDAYALNSIQNFVALGFFPTFGTSGGVTYDLAGYLMNDAGQLSLDFGTAFRAPTFTSDGRIRFGSYLGDLGEVPDDAIEPYVNTAVKLMETNGFYLVQTGEGTYDMVNAADARAWISWFQP